MLELQQYTRAKTNKLGSIDFAVNGVWSGPQKSPTN